MRETNVDLICRLRERGVHATLRDTKASLLAKLAETPGSSSSSSSSKPKPSESKTQSKTQSKKPVSPPRQSKTKPVSAQKTSTKKQKKPSTKHSSPKPRKQVSLKPLSPKSSSPKTPSPKSPNRSPSLSPLLYARQSPVVKLIAKSLEPLDPLALFDIKRLNEFFYFIDATSLEDYIFRCANYFATLTPIISFDKLFAWKQVTQNMPEWRNIDPATRKNYDFLFLEHLRTPKWSIDVACIAITLIVQQLYTKLDDFIPLVARVLHAFKYVLDDNQLLLLLKYLGGNILNHQTEYVELDDREVAEFQQEFLYALGPEQENNTLFLLSQLDMLFTSTLSFIAMREYFDVGLRTVADYIVSLPEYNFDSEQLWAKLDEHLTEISSYWREELTPKQRLKYEQQFFKWIDEPHLTRKRLIEMVGLRMKTELLAIEANTKQEYENVVAFIIGVLESYGIDYTGSELESIYVVIVDALEFMSEYWQNMEPSQQQHLETQFKKFME